MHIALIQLTPKHTEIFGTYIEYFIKKQIKFTIYYNLDKDPYSFIPYYSYLFNQPLDVKSNNHLPLDKENIDIFLYASASDHNHIPDILKNQPYINRSIFVQHQTTHILPFMQKFITVSPVINTAKMYGKDWQYILPIYKSYRSIHYKPQDKTIFGIIGGIRGTKTGKILDRDVTLIQDILEKYPNNHYQFRFFMRKWDWLWLIKRIPMLDNHPKIKAYFGLDTPNLIRKLKKVKFVLPLSKKNGWFYWQRLTGSIPLAINLNIPLLMDKRLAKIYNLEETSVIYDSRLEELFPNILGMPEIEYYDYIKKSVEYKIQMCHQNREAFKKLINIYNMSYADN